MQLPEEENQTDDEGPVQGRHEHRLGLRHALLPQGAEEWKVSTLPLPEGSWEMGNPKAFKTFISLLHVHLKTLNMNIQCTFTYHFLWGHVQMTSA